MCFIFLRCRQVKILIYLTLILFMSARVLCQEDDFIHSLFFMENLNGEFTRIIRSESDSEDCICGDVPESCSKKELSIHIFSCINISTIYRVNSSKDVFGKNRKYSLNAYRDVVLGREYVVPALHYIKTSNTDNVLGIGNPTNKTVYISIEYPSKQNFSFSLCENNTDTLELKGNEVIDFKRDCHIAGTHINASDKIIMYSAGALNGTAMAEQLIPVNLWGNYYVVFPSGKKLTKDIVTILTAYDNTTVHILGYDYVTIPCKYESIQRHITSTSAVTIRSSKPVSVTQYIKDEAEWTMITIVPMKYEINTTSITNWNKNNKYAFATTNGRPNHTKADEIPMFSKHYIRYLKQYDDSLTNYSIHGCRVLRDKPGFGIRFGSNCGLANLSQVDPEWPVMKPGDERDNDGNGITDEEDCFANFASLTNNTNKDCNDPFLSDTPDTFGSLFILPMTRLPENSSIHCFIDSMSEPFPALIIHKQTQAETNGWERHTLNTTGYQIIINQSIIQAQAEMLLVIETNRYENISLICHIACSDERCSNEFIVPPVDILQSQYIIPLLIHEVQCRIVTIFDNTSYSIPFFNIHENNLPRLHHKIFTFSQNHQKSVFIVASHIISVLCVEKYEKPVYFVQYVLPSTGMKYMLVKYEDPTNGVIAISLDDNTLLNVSDTDTDFSNKYIVLEKAGTASDEILKNTSSDLSISANKPIILLGVINCSCSPTTRNLVYVPAKDYVFNRKDMTNYSQIQNVSDCTKCRPQHFRLFQRKPQALSQQVPGDGLDNDQDGLVDEEYCGFLWNDSSIVDLDLDGSLNEDCKGCREGEMLNPKFRCQPCFFGTFRENSSRIDYCINCEDNFTTFSVRSSSLQDCVPICEEGMELNNETRMCKPCSISFYKNVSANETERSVSDRFWCKRCPGNLTTFTTRSTQFSDCIELCKKGSEFNNKTNKCKPCDLGFYKDIKASHIMCQPCPANFTTRSPGKTSSNDCKPVKCMCPCDRIHVQKNFTSGELATIIEEVKKELAVNKKQLSATLRTKISVKDNRPSAKSVGAFGVVAITLVFVLLLAADIVILRAHLSVFFHRLINFFKGS